LVLRPVFGFGDYPDDLHSALTKVIYVMYGNIVGKDMELTVLLDKAIPKSYTRVENIACCILSFAKLFWSEKFPKSNVFNIGENYLKAKSWFELLRIIQKNFSERNLCSEKDCVEIFQRKIRFIPEEDYLHYHNINDVSLQTLGLDFENQDLYVSIEEGISNTIESVIKNIDKEPYWL